MTVKFLLCQSSDNFFFFSQSLEHGIEPVTTVKVADEV